jgi:dienelactone hydrolase
VAGLFFVEHIERPSAKTLEPPGNEEEVMIGGEELGLPGTLMLPEGKGPFPAAILVHGSGPNDRDGTIGPNKPLRDVSWGLAKRGIATLRYDKRSWVSPEDLVDFADALTVREEVIDDALAGLALLRSRPEVDAERIFVLGHSLGGTLAPRIAQHNPRPAGVIALAGASLPLPEKMLEQTRYIASLDGVTTPEEKKRLDELSEAVMTIRTALGGEANPSGYYLGAPVAYYRDLEAFDAPATTALLGLPTLVIQGGRDYQVTMDDFAKWHEALADKPFACLVVYERLDHIFRKGTGPSRPRDYQIKKPMDPAVIDCIAGWIETGACPE